MRRLPGKWFELEEVAEGLQIWPQTLRNWRAKGIADAQPAGQVLFEGRWVYLYDDAAVERVRAYAKAHYRRQRGRFKPEEIAERKRQRDLAFYHEAQAARPDAKHPKRSLARAQKARRRLQETSKKR